MPSPSTHQDSPKVAWPKVVYAVGTPDYPDEGVGLYKDGVPGGLKRSPDHEVKPYIPISALLSDEAAEAIAMRHYTSRHPHWDELPASQKAPLIANARLDLQSAIQQVGGAER